MFERCNFACVELAGFMPLQCKCNGKGVLFSVEDLWVSVEDVFNDLNDMGLQEDLNSIALPAEEQQRIKEDVKNLLGN